MAYAGNCPFGDNAEHFENREEAVARLEEVLVEATPRGGDAARRSSIQGEALATIRDVAQNTPTGVFVRHALFNAKPMEITDREQLARLMEMDAEARRDALYEYMDEEDPYTLANAIRQGVRSEVQSIGEDCAIKTAHITEEQWEQIEDELVDVIFDDLEAHGEVRERIVKVTDDYIVSLMDKG